MAKRAKSTGLHWRAEDIDDVVSIGATTAWANAVARKRRYIAYSNGI